MCFWPFSNRVCVSTWTPYSIQMVKNVYMTLKIKFLGLTWMTCSHIWIAVAVTPKFFTQTSALTCPIHTIQTKVSSTWQVLTTGLIVNSLWNNNKRLRGSLVLSSPWRPFTSLAEFWHNHAGTLNSFNTYTSPFSMT